ncbi:nuclear transport factor 2 family protein [Phenylobacterium sp. LjRoot219]|uniref:nuclear transport factor 2 family protein n=1 Tax=Phenylobacterium sp. LjRoot219 TaxID=3342283 RepID=UPI003ECCA4BA
MALSTRSLAAGAALLMIFGLGPQVLAPPRSIAERGVRLALIRLNGLLSRRDLSIVHEFVAAADTLLIGAEPGERARGRAEIEAYYEQLFAKPEALSFAWREVDVSVRGDVAWIHAEGDVVRKTDSGEVRRPYRLAGVLEPHGGDWKWRMFQGCEPAASA